MSTVVDPNVLRAAINRKTMMEDFSDAVEGYLYILGVKDIDLPVSKIGRTLRNPAVRCAEINQSATGDFLWEVAHKLAVNDCRKFEALVHAKLSPLFTRAVVLYPGWYIESTGAARSSEVWVLNPKALPSFISNNAVHLSAEDVNLCAYHLGRYVRTVES